MKLVVCGTPAFAVPTLPAVLAAGHEVALVATQPDRPVGRKASLTPPALKVAALGRGIAVVQPDKIKNNPEFQALLETIAPDAILIVAYGRIVPKWMLDLPRFGNLNLHGSLLPKYRGAAPIQWAIANGETVTGVTTMRIDEGLDTGDILLQRNLPIGPDMTAEELYPLLAELGAGLMVETLAGLEAGSIAAQKQDDAQASFAPILTRDDAMVDFTRTAREIYNRWRGFQPWPGAYTFLSGKRLSLNVVAPGLDDDGPASEPGTLLIDGEFCVVACGKGTWLRLYDVQLEGKKSMPMGEFLRGAGRKSGDRLG
jgi:methionyl-tRNA formyltransferase